MSTAAPASSKLFDRSHSPRRSAQATPGAPLSAGFTAAAAVFAGLLFGTVRFWFRFVACFMAQSFRPERRPCASGAVLHHGAPFVGFENRFDVAIHHHGTMIQPQSSIAHLAHRRR